MNNTVSTPHSSSVAFKITLAIIIVLIVGALVWLGRTSPNTARDANGLTEAEKEAILESLRNTEVPELTEEEKAIILEDLRNTEAPELTEAEREAILESLRQQ